MLGLEVLDEIVYDENKPNDAEVIRYLFWEKGISLEEFNRLPLSYIFEITNTLSWIKKEEEKEYKKASRKK